MQLGFAFSVVLAWSTVSLEVLGLFFVWLQKPGRLLTEMRKYARVSMQCPPIFH